jgi:hypothetical protein
MNAKQSSIMDGLDQTTNLYSALSKLTKKRDVTAPSRLKLHSVFSRRNKSKRNLKEKL